MYRNDLRKITYQYRKNKDISTKQNKRKTVEKILYGTDFLLH